MVDFADNPEQAAFRTQVKDFIATKLPPELKLKPDEVRGFDEEDPEDKKEAMGRWRAALAENGWIAPMWPKSIGGADLTKQEQFIVNEEFAASGAPRLTVHTVGPTIMVHGTEEQKKEYLPPILTGETRWCQGYSEPGSGSDLASLQTRAVRDGDDFVINGQKIWTSGAHLANWMFMLVRTDPDAPKHRGISYLLLSMKTPGISVRPLMQMAGRPASTRSSSRTCASPRATPSARRTAAGTSAPRCSTSSARTSASPWASSRRSTRCATSSSRSATRRPAARRSATPRWSATSWPSTTSRPRSLTASRAASSRCRPRGQIPNYEASMAKIFNTELSQRIARTATKILGLYGDLFSETEDGYTPMKRRWSRMYLSTVSATIAGGTSEIQRNVIATRGLGLPRG